MQMQTSVAVCMCCLWPLGCRVGQDRKYQFWAVPVLVPYTEFVIFTEEFPSKAGIRKYSP